MTVLYEPRELTPEEEDEYADRQAQIEEERRFERMAQAQAFGESLRDLLLAYRADFDDMKRQQATAE